MSKLSNQKTKADAERYVAVCIIAGTFWTIVSIVCVIVGFASGGGTIFAGLFCAAVTGWFAKIRISEVIAYYRLRQLYRVGDPDIVNDPELQVIFGDGAPPPSSKAPGKGLRNLEEMRWMTAEDPQAEK
jgi:hypothetical protein